MHEPDRGSRRPTITTTHAAWGAGHPRILVIGPTERYVHAINCDLTHIGSAADSDIVLASTDALHAKILHNTSDEYELTMVGPGATSFGPNETLRTGAHFSAGPWELVFVRDEFADHGRPYGGRRGGELAVQRQQKPRPDYAQDHPESSLGRCALKNQDDTKEPGEILELSRAVLASAHMDSGEARTPDFELLNDETAGVYEAIVGDKPAGGVTYNRAGDSRVVLLAVSVFPEFRGTGISSEMIRRVLDDIRAQGATITNYCPVVNTFIELHPAYADLVDSDHPGRAG
jgi:predicted GNAT family acetyltransferase